ncbi:MAG: tetratricopeptide repeat protein [Burkholderiales bacterium]
MKAIAVIFAAALAASLPAAAMEQEETFTDLVPGNNMLDPGNLAQLIREGDVRAMNNIGLLWAKGYQGKQSYEEAMRWWLEAARRGYTVAMNNIGLAYANGHGVDKDAAKAFEWWHQAAFLGNAWAMNSVGDCYDKGEGVEQDFIMAMTWYQSAAQLRDRMALYNIGALFEDGKGVTRDYVEAMSWYRKSAEKGDASAMRAIGRLYRNGLGVNMDPVEAWAWHSVADSRFRPEEAGEAKLNRRELEQVGAALSAGQLTQARTRAEQIDLLTRPPVSEQKAPHDFRGNRT